MASKDEAQQNYEEAQARYRAAYDELLEARKALDGHLMREEAERRAVFMSFNPAVHPQGEDREVGVNEALEQIEARRRQKAAAQPADGPIGGVA